MDHRICPPHLKGLRSDFVMKFIENHYKEFPANPCIIDLGSGRWRHARLFRTLGVSKIYCIDRNNFPQKPTGIKFLNHNLEESIPLPDKKFDIILCCYLLMFIKNRSYLLKEITRVAREGAYLVIEINENQLSNGFIIDKEELKGSLYKLNWSLVSKISRPVGDSFIFIKNNQKHLLT